MRNDNKPWKKKMFAIGGRVGKQLGGVLAGQLGAAARPVRGLYQKGKKVASNVYKKGGKA